MHTCIRSTALNALLCFRGTKLMSDGGKASYVKGPYTTQSSVRHECCCLRQQSLHLCTVTTRHCL